MLPLLYLKEELNEGRQPVNRGQCDFHHERLHMSAAKLGGAIGSSNNPAESSN